ncbi:uncharacterized protein K460DRAFT_146027 [Cucurbitaria berberidis CBS 394.84]|uniref:Uncharacterized protein n=1 Tax=Cucurbitaria berberidis CBS 394.84 TaxID=1168544 RepID=A0A9P4GD71_9PLEO|nr:uncharacterized protein K460DRAFT_146027 [Cucurbitaria berberidis CBS 394.84]KAF1843467.1 hypothetical protein K460DRAFT_146027 [Cucurbitaria berberidis CBS 394.84]
MYGSELGGRVGVERRPSGLSVLTRARICRSEAEKETRCANTCGWADRVAETYQESGPANYDDLGLGRMQGKKRLAIVCVAAMAHFFLASWLLAAECDGTRCLAELAWLVFF